MTKKLLEARIHELENHILALAGALTPCYCQDGRNCWNHSGRGQRDLAESVSAADVIRDSRKAPGHSGPKAPGHIGPVRSPLVDSEIE